MDWGQSLSPSCQESFLGLISVAWIGWYEGIYRMDLNFRGFRGSTTICENLDQRLLGNE